MQQFVRECDIHLDAVVQVILNGILRDPDGVLPCLPVARPVRFDDIPLYPRRGAPP